MHRKTLALAAAIFFIGVMASELSAYTYEYRNRTDHLIRVCVHLYGEPDKWAELEPNGSYVVSTPSLIQSWSTEALLDQRWEQVLNLTCDLLPGNYLFTIHVKETKGPDGKATRSWEAVSQGPDSA